MKIGIITFHWGTNYGGVLQAYALQTFLKNLGHDVCIINYKPNRYNKNLIKCFKTFRAWSYLNNYHEFLKEKKIETFRANYLNRTVLYQSTKDLNENPPSCDAYITGSDQVWNPFFTIKGEGKPTTAYFLDFGNKEVKRIAYAVSFGCKDYPDNAKKIAKQHVDRFDAISVRENSGLKIVREMGCGNSIILPDPALLLSPKQYQLTIKKVEIKDPSSFVFSYFIHNKEKTISKLIKHFKTKAKVKRPDKFFNPYSIEEWLAAIKNSSFVITNSYHGVVFSLLFKKDFIIVLTKGRLSGMNDRIYTLLNYLNLEKRIINSYDTKNINEIISTPINYNHVEKKIGALQKKTYSFFEPILC
jgi:polysaccharide pyruvyl transferase WcaK-like protein